MQGQKKVITKKGVHGLLASVGSFRKLVLVLLDI